jgi:hypothetical protein
MATVEFASKAPPTEPDPLRRLWAEILASREPRPTADTPNGAGKPSGPDAAPPPEARVRYSRD